MMEGIVYFLTAREKKLFVNLAVRLFGCGASFLPSSSKNSPWWG